MNRGQAPEPDDAPGLVGVELQFPVTISPEASHGHAPLSAAGR